MKKNEVKQEMINQVDRLPEVEVIDNTTTKKNSVNAKFNIIAESEQLEKLEKLDKNKVFAEVNEYFCPVVFDDTLLNESLSPLVSAGVMSEDVKTATIEKAKKEFYNLHADELEAANKLSFAEVVAKLQENDTLYKRMLTACNVTSLEESNYIDKDGKVLIYRASQCLDKEGNNRYQTATLKRTENGKEFSQPLFVELRDQNTTNILLAIRYYASKQNAAKSLLNKVADYRRILTNVRESVMRAKENGFSLEQILREVRNVCGWFTFEVPTDEEENV